MERDCGENNKDYKCDNFLNHFELHQRKGSSVSVKSDAVSGYLKTVLEEGDSPRKEDHENEWRGVAKEADVLQFEVAVPGKRHKDIRRYK